MCNAGACELCRHALMDGLQNSGGVRGAEEDTIHVYANYVDRGCAAWAVCVCVCVPGNVCV